MIENYRPDPEHNPPVRSAPSRVSSTKKTQLNKERKTAAKATVDL